VKLQVFAVYDSVAEVYGRPFFSQTVGSAVRGFSDEINRGERDNPLSAHPKDFALFHLGSFEDQFAEWEIKQQPQLCVRGEQVLIKGSDNVSK